MRNVGPQLADYLSYQLLCKSLPTFRVEVISIEVVFWFFKKVESLFRKRKSCSLSQRTWESMMAADRTSRKSTKRTTRDRRKHNCGGTVGISIKDLLNRIALHFQEMLHFRLRWLHQTLSNDFSLSLGQSWWKGYLAGLGIIRRAYDIVVPALVQSAGTKSRWL